MRWQRGGGRGTPALEPEAEEALLTLLLGVGTTRATGIVTRKGQDRKGLVSEASRARPVRGRQTEHESTPTAKAKRQKRPMEQQAQKGKQ